MSDTDTDQKLLETYAEAAGALVARALSKLNTEKAELVSQALNIGAASICITTALDPLIVSGWLQPRTDAVPALLFRISCDGPGTEGWN